MSRLPTNGADNDAWGAVLNDYLQLEHNADGTHKPKAPSAHAATHQPGGSDPMAVDAAAATPSLRSLGSGAQQAAAGTHTHAGGGTSLATLSDVAIASPAESQGLVFNGTSWKNVRYHYNVSAFSGVVLDGVTDDGPAINTVLAAVYAAHGSGDPKQGGALIEWPADSVVAIGTPITLYSRQYHLGISTRLSLIANCDFFQSVNFGRIIQAQAGSTTTVINLPASYAPATNSLAGKTITVMAGAANAQGTAKVITSNTTTTITIPALTSAPTTGDYFNVGGNSGTVSNDGAYNAGIDGFILDANRLTNTGQFNGLSIYGAGNTIHNLKMNDVALWTEWNPTTYIQLAQLWFNPSTGAQGTSASPPAGAHLLGYGAVANDYDNLDMEFINMSTASQMYSPHYVATANDYGGSPITAGWVNLGPGDARCGRVEIEATMGYITGMRGMYLGGASQASSTAFAADHLMISQNFDVGLDIQSGQSVITADVSGMRSIIVLMRGNGNNTLNGRIGSMTAKATPPAGGTAGYAIQIDSGSNMHNIDLDCTYNGGIAQGNFVLNFNGGGIASKIRLYAWNNGSANTVATQTTMWTGTPPSDAEIELVNVNGSIAIPGAGTWPPASGAAPINYLQRPTGTANGSGVGTINLGAIATGATITPVGECQIAVAPAGNITGVILASGTYRGQEVVIFNESANTVTFAASGTSHVADGVSAIIAANSMKVFRWNDHDSLWFHG